MAYSSNKRQFMIEMVGKYGELLNWSAITAEETDDEETVHIPADSDPA